MQLVNFAKMKYLNTEGFVKALQFLRRYISPAYITMFVAAFLLWYITKLGEVYTTDHQMTVVIDGEEYCVDCTIRGKGIDLIDYTMSARRSRFNIPASELSYDNIPNGDGSITCHVSSVSLQQALAARVDGIEVIAVGSLPTFKIEPEGRVEAQKPPVDEYVEASVAAPTTQPSSAKSTARETVERQSNPRPTKPKSSGPVTTTVKVADRDEHVKY